MVIPDTFGRKGERIIPTYDFINLTEGTGIISYYIGTALDDSATSDFIMSSNTFYSQAIETAIGTVTPTAAFTLIGEKNYDASTITKPTAIRGLAIGTICFGIYGHASATITGYLKIKLIKVSGGETILGTAQTPEIAQVTTAAWTAGYLASFKMDISETHLKIGDNLRISVEAWMKSSTGSHQANMGWGSDPQNRDGSFLTPSSEDVITKTHINTPFKINL